jgi:hypothetical protein
MKKLPFSRRLWFWPVLAMLVVEVWLAIVAIKPGTWLVGWDNTMPELDFGLNFGRILNAPWQEYRGLGVADGMAHGANLSHWVIVRLLALILPIHFARYAFVFLAHFVGMMGMFWLLNKTHVLRQKKIAALFAGLFYGLNPFTLQLFHAPLELFLIHYAALPWSVAMLMHYLESGKRRDLFYFAGVSLLFVSQAHVPTVFISYGLVLGMVMFWWFMLKKQWKRVLKAVLALVIVNAFWLLPYVVNVFSTTGDITRAKMNVMSTLETQLRNDAYGDFASVALMRSFNLDYEDWLGGREFGLQFQVWRNWWDMSWVRFGLWVILGIVIVGFVNIVVNGKLRKRFWPFGVCWIVGLLVLGSEIPVIGLLYQWVRDYVPYLGQLLRFTFTKFGMMFVFGASACLAVGVDFLMKKIGMRVLALIPLLLLMSWPVFQGEFLYSKLKLEIPAEYFDVKTYFDSQSSEQRIVYLPLSSYWGWEFNEWNYRGSGFLWQMIKQPLLMRSFDPWSGHNETFYNELSTAFYMCPTDPDEGELTKCARNVVQVFEKYQVSLALLDESVILPGQDEEIMRYELWKRVLVKLDPAADFDSGFLSVYTVGEATTGISTPESYRAIEAETTYGRFDPYYSNRTAYVDGGQAQFPFAGLSKEDLSRELDYAEDGTVAIMGEEVAGGTVVFPAFSKGDMWQGRLRATLSGEALSVELLPFGELVVGEQRFPLWLDQRLEVVEIPSALESVVIQVGNTTKRIVRDTPDELWDVPMVAGERLVVRVFEGEGQTVKAIVASVRLGQLPPDRLIQVIGEGRVCLGYEQTDYQCLNQGPLLVTPQAGVYWLDMLEKVDTYPEVKIFQLIADYEFPAKMWETAKREFTLDIRDKRHEIRWEQVIGGLEVGSKKYEESSENCDVLKRGSAQKSFVDGGVLYEATDYGAYCDSWWVGSIHEEGILRLFGENLAGRGMKLAVFSSRENRTNLEQLLPSGGEFDQSYGFLTGLQQGSTINVETKAFGRIEGKNRLDAVKFYSVPLTWLQKVKIGDETIIDNDLEIGVVQKWGTGIYKLKTQMSKVKGQNGLIVLNQGFDKGWIGFQLITQNSKLKIQKLEHVKVNGWGNGFIVEESGSKKKEEGSGNQVIWIVYWPQMLQWVGFGLLPLGMFFIARKLRS